MLGRALATGAMAATLFLVPAETAQAHVFAGCAGNKVAPFGVTDANSCVNPEDLAFADYCIRTLGHSLNANPSQAKRDAQAGVNLPNHIICEGDAAVFPANPGGCGIYASRQETDGQLGTRQNFCAPKLKSGETECPAGLQHSPESHECTWLPPVAVRVEADLVNEMFTLSWRAPEIAATATIVGYHIRRMQNNERIPDGQNVHPTHCDGLTENQFKRSDNGAARSDYSFLNGGITVVAADVFTVTVRTARPTNPQESYGSCYRWHIAAFTAERGGAEAVTDPILSRSSAGRDGCAAGEAKPWESSGVFGACTAHVEGGEWCARQGGTLITTGGVYQCSTSAACSGGGFVEASSGVCDLTSGGVCGAFSEFSLEQRECQCVGIATEQSRTHSGAGQVCQCLTPGADENCEIAATCPEGQVRVIGEGCAQATPVNLCKSRGWTVTLVSGAQVCEGFTAVDGASGARSTQCRFAAEPANLPACSAVFGQEHEFPQREEADERFFAYNCDADSDVPRGLIPATANTTEAEECSCAEGYVRQGGIPHDDADLKDFFLRGACILNGGGSFMGTSLGGLCALNGWTLTSEGGGKCRIPVRRGAGGDKVNGCFIAGNNAPQCDDVFGRQGRETSGDDLATIFPASPEGEVVYVYDCGEGFAPKMLNMRGEQECECASLEGVMSGTCDCPTDSHYELGSACIPKEGGFGDVRQETLCAAFGGTAADEGAGGRVCKGLDKAGTFCFLDSAEVFPCRGLFKHLRTCNLLYQRPALNPFVCDEKCPGGANGKGMGCADG